MKRKTFHLITMFSLIFGVTSSFSEARAPELVISAFVYALQKNDSEYLKKYVDIDRIKNQPKNSYTVENLRSIFEKVDVSEIKYTKSVYDKESKIIRIRMTKPLSFYFELEHQNTYQDTTKNKGDFYRIIGIHP